MERIWLVTHTYFNEVALKTSGAAAAALLLSTFADETLTGSERFLNIGIMHSDKYHYA